MGDELPTALLQGEFAPPLTTATDVPEAAPPAFAVSEPKRPRLNSAPSALVADLLRRAAPADVQPSEETLVAKIWAEAQEARARGVPADLPDHGTWSGSWSLPARIDV